MNKEVFLNKILSILPTNINNIIQAEVINDSLIISSESTKYTFKCYTKHIEASSQCKTFLHKDMQTGEVFYKNKKKYNTDKEAIQAAMKINIMDKTIHKRVAYKCKECKYWHVGRNKSILEKEDKIKLKIKHNL